MPVLLREGPYRFFIVSWDRNEPPHVHVQRDADVAKFWLTPVSLADGGRFGAVELRRIEDTVRERREQLLERWYDHFGRQD